MTEQTKTTDWRATTGTEGLVLYYALCQDQLAKAQDNLRHTERVIIERMEGENTRALAIDGYDVTLKRPTLYDRSLLYPLAELVPPDELAKAFEPAHDEDVPASVVHVPEQWDMRKVLPLVRYGEKVKAVINRASYPGAPSLKVVAKESAQ